MRTTWHRVYYRFDRLYTQRAERLWPTAADNEKPLTVTLEPNGTVSGLLTDKLCIGWSAFDLREVNESPAARNDQPR